MNKNQTRNNWQIKHGMAGTKLYKTWHNIRSRCNNPKATKYENYGGKGISVCREWEESFERFMDWSLNNGYKEGLTIDRIDGEKGYTPENCRWTTYKVQNNNTAQNHLITFQGKTMNVTQWANHLGISKKMLGERIRRGWEIERALTTPKINKLKTDKKTGRFVSGS